MFIVRTVSFSTYYCHVYDAELNVFPQYHLEAVGNVLLDSHENLGLR